MLQEAVQPVRLDTNAQASSECSVELLGKSSWTRRLICDPRIPHGVSAYRGTDVRGVAAMVDYCVEDCEGRRQNKIWGTRLQQVRNDGTENC